MTTVVAPQRSSPAPDALLDRLLAPDRLRILAIMWTVTAACALGWHLWMQTAAGLTDGAGHPFGDDYLNFWSAARLGVLGRAAEVYDMAAFHRFEIAQVGHGIDFYHYSYPPVLMVLTAPLGLLPVWVGYLAWQALGWIAFAACLRVMSPRGWLLYALSLPAVFLSLWGGQNGDWTAAIVGWSLLGLGRRPLAAGVLASMLIFKPQLAALFPLALLAGGHWRALAGFALGGLALLAAATLAYGPDIWMGYSHQLSILRPAILENGEGVWRRMISVFVFLRHAGASTTLAYAGQAAVSALAAVLVAAVWRSAAAPALKNVVLVLAALIASPYVSDYDLVMLAFIPVWFAGAPATAGARAARLASAGLIVAPLAAAPLSMAFGTAVGGALLLPALGVAVAAIGWTAISPAALRRPGSTAHGTL